MPFFVIPSRRLRQPYGRIVVNWRNPLTRDLAFLVVYSDRASRNLATGQTADLVGTEARVFGTDSIGGYLTLSSIASPFYASKWPGAVVTSDGAGTGGFTFLSYSAPVAEAYTQAMLSQSTTGGSQAGFLLANVASNYAASSGALAIGFNGSSVLSVAGKVDGRPHVFMGGRTGQNAWVAVDGVTVGSGTAAAYARDVYTAASSEIWASGIKGYNSYTRVAPHYLQAAWNRDLSPEERTTVGRFPWSLFEEEVRRLYFVAGAGGGTVVTESVAGRLTAKASDTSAPTRTGSVTGKLYARGSDASLALRSAAISGRVRSRGSVAAAPVAASTITLTDVVDGRIVQRSGTTGSLVIAGTYTGSAPTHVQARIVQDGTSTEALTWTTLTSETISGGSFSGMLSGIPQGGWYNIQVRYSNDTGVVSNGTHKLGVGALYAFAGQSNASGAFTMTPWETPDAKMRQYSGSAGTAWATPTFGAGAVKFANDLVTALSIPIGVLNYGVIGSGLNLAQFPGGWLNTSAGSVYDDFLDGVDSVGGKLEGVIWLQGEADAVAAISKSTYYTDVGTLFGRVRSHFSQSSLPILICPLGRYTGGDATDDEWQAVRDAHLDAADDSNNYLGGQTYDLPNDGVHYNASGWNTLGTRLALRAREILGLTTNSRGPSITSSVLVSNTTNAVIDVNVALRGGTTITPASSITGFRVLDDTTPKTISSAARQSATSVRLTLSGTLSGTGHVQYMWGLNPAITGPVYDDSANTLPLESTDSTGVVAETTKSAAGRTRARGAAATLAIRNTSVIGRLNARGADTVTSTRLSLAAGRVKPRAAVSATPVVAGMVTTTVAGRLRARGSAATTATRIEAIAGRITARGTDATTSIRAAVAAGRLRAKGRATSGPYVAPTLPLEVPKSSRTLASESIRLGSAQVAAEPQRLGATPVRKAPPRLG